MKIKKEQKEIWLEQVNFYGSLSDVQESLDFYKEKYKNRKVFFKHDQDNELWLKEEILETLNEAKTRIKNDKNKLKELKKESREILNKIAKLNNK